MPLARAIASLATPSTIQAESTDALANRVAVEQGILVAAKLPNALPHKAHIERVPELDAPIVVRPIQALLELSRGTIYRQDWRIQGISQFWPILRYMGMFERDDAINLHLRGEDLAIIGPNQRRVLSEDLGIGFGILLAKHWCRERIRARGGPVPVIASTDFDQALHFGQLQNFTVTARQPDYALSYPDPNNPEVTIFELLEAKGTATSGNALKQLGKAATQLASVTVDQNPVTGIAISTIPTSDAIRVFSIDPPGPVVRQVVTRTWLNEMQSSISERIPPTARLGLPRQQFAAKVASTNYASLALFGGLAFAAREWSPPAELPPVHLHTQQTSRVIGNQSFHGHEITISSTTSEQRLSIFQGLESNVSEALTSLSPERVQSAQRELANLSEGQSLDFTEESESHSGDSATAISSDGSILSVRLE